jgi:hypothetical protein
MLFRTLSTRAAAKQLGRTKASVAVKASTEGISFRARGGVAAWRRSSVRGHPLLKSLQEDVCLTYLRDVKELGELAIDWRE